MREAFAMQKRLTFFPQKYWCILHINIGNFNETLPNNVVSFEQPGPELWISRSGREIFMFYCQKIIFCTPHTVSVVIMRGHKICFMGELRKVTPELLCILSAPDKKR